jgi:exonuclease SbcC
MGPALETISITNFRSVRGTVSVPLGAQIVLLHGANGAGKSTVISALELALTGEISDLSPDDRRHLIHRGADRAAVELSSEDHSHTIALGDDGEITGDPLLPVEDGRFLAERCYLRQRTLGKLLELYDEPGINGDSPLTVFVKDLLGLDELEALIEGLDPVGDIRRLRNAVPEYRQAETELQRARDLVADATNELNQVDQLVSAAREQLAETLTILEAPPALPTEPASAAAWLDTQTEQASLAGLVEARQELGGMQRRLAKVGPAPPGQDRDRARNASAAARSAADTWWQTTGAELEAVLDELRAILPGIPAATGADPADVHASALKQLRVELDRLSSAISADDAAIAEEAKVDAEIEASKARASAIDEQLAASRAGTDLSELGKTLAALVPQVHDDNCPVCGRAFGEVSGEPLVAHLAARISQLGQEAERLQALSKARIEALADIRDLEERQAALAGRRLESEAKTRATMRVARLTTAQQRLTALGEGVAQGAATIRKAVETERDVLALEASDRTSAEIRTAAQGLATTLGRVVDSAKSARELIDELAEHVHERIAAIEKREEHRTRARRLIDELATTTAALEGRHADVAATKAVVARVGRQIKDADRRRELLKKTRADAEAARIRIVRQVFNSSLNRLWRDLFVRLAPDEPFVPFFDVPETARVVASLETVHRDGDRFGSPDVMLSAGNLNTAALTLFLALHLSVEQRLPWLLLDDPVQSMDEVHVAQFAALLRTVAHEHARRIVIAVHERPLFDYLALELSPGRAAESLVTVELSRSQEGTTLVQPQYRPFDEDIAFAVA